MSNNIVTADFSDFGYVELGKAKDLLTAYMENKLARDSVKDWISDGLKICFNKNSGYVFFSDEDYNTFLLNENDELDVWLNCPECGTEGFPKELIANEHCNECKEYAERYLE